MVSSGKRLANTSPAMGCFREGLMTWILVGMSGIRFRTLIPVTRLLIEPGTAVSDPHVAVGLEGRRLGCARVVVIAKLETASRADLVGRQPQNVLVRGLEDRVGWQRPRCVRRRLQTCERASKPGMCTS